MGLVLSWVNLVDAAATSLYADSEAGGLGVQALRSPPLSEVWRTGLWTSTAITLDVDLGSAQAIGVIALAAPRDGMLPSSLALLRVTASTVSPSGTEVLDTRGVGAHNMLVNSQNFPAWTASAATVIAIAAPDPVYGGIGVFGLQDNATSSGHFVRQTADVAAGASYTFSVYAQADTSARLELRAVTLDASVTIRVRFDLAAGTATTTVAGWLTASAIVAVGAGWHRVSITFLAAVSITMRYDIVCLPANGTSLTYAGTGATQIRVFGAQVERSDSASAYVLTQAEPSSAMQFLLPQMAGFGLWAYRPPTTLTARYLRLRLVGSAEDRYFQAGRLWIGPALTTARQVAYGHETAAIDPGQSARAAITGVRDVQRGRPYRRARWPLGQLTAAEAEALRTAALTVGTTGQVFAARIETDLAGTGLFGAFVEPPTLRQAAHAVWQSEILIEEDV